MNSQKSKDSTDSRYKLNSDYKHESSSDDYDALKEEIHRQNTKSLPISMKNIPQIHFQTPSRDSLRGESINRQNKVDTYFSDLNGNSLISTLNSSKDLFGAISSSNLSQRNSLLSGSKSNRGINAANQILFGSHATVIPAFQSSFPESSDRLSHDGYSQNGDDYFSSRDEKNRNMFSSYTSRVMNGNSYNQNHKLHSENMRSVSDPIHLPNLSYQRERY